MQIVVRLLLVRLAVQTMCYFVVLTSLTAHLSVQTVQYFVASKGKQSIIQPVNPKVSDTDTTMELEADLLAPTLPEFGEKFIQIGNFRIADVEDA